MVAAEGVAAKSAVHGERPGVPGSTVEDTHAGRLYFGVWREQIYVVPFPTR
jgi:hypothetical protein